MTWRTLLLIVVLVPLEVMLSILINEPEDITHEIYKERTAIGEWVGEQQAIAIIEASNAYYTSLFIDSGIQQAVHHLFVPTEQGIVPIDDAQERGKEVFMRVESNLMVLWIGIYYALQRLSLLAAWIPYFLPLVIPAVINGYMNREIKKVTYGFASQWRYEVSFRMLSGLIVAPFIYLFYPGAINPVFVPLWAIMLTITSLLMFSNIQKQL